jgi:hypothetical protein
MSAPGRHSPPPWALPVAVAALIAGPIALYALLPLAGLSASLVSAAVLIVAVKHLGLLAVLAAPLYALLRRRRQQ